MKTGSELKEVIDRANFLSTLEVGTKRPGHENFLSVNIADDYVEVETTTMNERKEKEYSINEISTELQELVKVNFDKISEMSEKVKTAKGLAASSTDEISFKYLGNFYTLTRFVDDAEVVTYYKNLKEQYIAILVKYKVMAESTL